MSYSKLILVGNLGKDPDMRYTPSGQAVATFSMAVNRQYTTSAGEEKKETTWFRVTTWGKLAEVVSQYLKKGREVLVDGRLICDPETGGPKVWTRQDGTPGASFEVTAENIRFLGSAPHGAAEGAPDNAEEGAPADDSSIPF